MAPSIHFGSVTTLLTFAVITTNALTYQELISIGTSSMQKQHQCQTLVFLQSSNPPSTKTFDKPVVLISNLNETFDNRLLPFKVRERTDFEIIQSSALGLLKFSTQCSWVFARSSSNNMKTLLSSALKARLAIATRDLFVLETPNPNEGIWTSWGISEVVENWIIIHFDSGQRTFGCALQMIATYSDSFHFCTSILPGRMLRVGALLGDQFIHFRNNPDGSVNSGGGIYFLMLRDMSQRYNFTLRLIPVAGTGFRNPETGEWSGAVGDLVSGRYDVAFPVAVSISRHRVIDSTNLVEWFSRMFWVQAPPVVVSPLALIQPFELETWMLVLATMISASITFYCFLRRHTKKQGNGHIIGMDYLAEITIRVTLEQSFAIRDKWEGPMRLFFVLWAVITLTLTTAYRSKLFFFLTFLTSPEVPRTHIELSMADYNLVFRSYGGFALNFWKQSSDPVHKRFLESEHFTQTPTSADCILRAATQERSACLDYDFSGYYAIAANTTLHVRSEGRRSTLLIPSKDRDAARALVTWAFPKGSVLKNVFKDAVLWMQASGMYNKWIDMDWSHQRIKSVRWFRQTESYFKRKLHEAEEGLEGGVKPLQTSNMIVPFITHFLVCALGIVCFGAELLLNYKRRKIMKTDRRQYCLRGCSKAMRNLKRVLETTLWERMNPATHLELTE